jgi:hypothetical protein
VKHGFSFPILPKIITMINGASIQPGGMVRQFGLTASSGARELKERLTQDLSYSVLRGGPFSKRTH